MQLTNNKNLPESVRKWLEKDLYEGYSDDPYTISVTTLLKPIQEIVLARQHADKITVDVSERFWSLLGQGVHAVLEYNAEKRPERITTKVGKWTVTGKYDEIVDNCLIDYKVTSAWTLVYGSRQDEWNKQLSLYRWLLHSNGVTVDKKAYIIAFLRDWAERNSKSENYPTTDIVELTFECEPFDAVDSWVRMRLLAIEGGLGGSLLHCTDDERWLNKGKYAKCAKYCSVRSVCVQGGMA